MKRLMIIVPCYNEEEVFESTAKVLDGVITDLAAKKKIAENSGIIFVNDGSKDSTWELIEKEQAKNSRVIGVKLAGNVGHQTAVFAGLDVAKDMCDMSVTIDADLQDDPKAIEKMVDSFNNGCDIVFGVRSDRSSDSFFKRFTAQGFYKFMEKMGVKTLYNHADFRLMSNRAMRQLLLYKENDLYLRGLVMKLGYKTDSVYYSRTKRMAGETKYPLSKMLRLATNGITSFSLKPITLICIFGFLFMALSMMAAVALTVVSIVKATLYPWLILLISMWFIAGMLMFSIGMVGQYAARAFLESKDRPRFVIDKIIGNK